MDGWIAVFTVFHSFQEDGMVIHVIIDCVQ